eukprot:TRINITY_DN1004_c0_g1_i3.p1 TRINITY_DN1004_c0_g1~~TRINITY_DN1004_c0_g1_i3.p1  ORF type:complete len:1393 (-),score=417.62 TRINITY_DN1004_c0_g1_i3:22-4200(-)
MVDTPEPSDGASGGPIRITTDVGVFTLGSKIGKGGFGTVYQGFHVGVGEFVAVKQMLLSAVPKQQLSSIMGEIDLLKELRHDHIVRYITYCKTKEHLNIVMEFVEKGSLSSIMRQFGTFPEQLTAFYIGQVLEGLCYLHNEGVVHRDIKAANILVTKDGDVKIADFGVAANIDQMSDLDVMGSPYWMAPEVVELSGASTKSDIWSVGCTVIELLTGQPPYFDLTPMSALFRMVQDESPPVPDGISASLQDFLISSFKKDPAQRVTADRLLKHKWITEAMKARAAQKKKLTKPEDAGKIIKAYQQKKEEIKMKPLPPPSKDEDKLDDLVASAATLSTATLLDNFQKKELQPEAEEEDWDDFGDIGDIDADKILSLKSPEKPKPAPTLQVQIPAKPLKQALNVDNDNWDDDDDDDDDWDADFGGGGALQLQQPRSAHSPSAPPAPNADVSAAARKTTASPVQSASASSPSPHGSMGPTSPAPSRTSSTSSMTPPNNVEVDFSQWEEHDEFDLGQLGLEGRKGDGEVLHLKVRAPAAVQVTNEDDNIFDDIEESSEDDVDEEKQLREELIASSATQVTNLMKLLKSDTGKSKLLETLDKLSAVFAQFNAKPEDKRKLLKQGIIPLVEMLDVLPDSMVIAKSLKLLNVVVEGNAEILIGLCLVGGIMAVLHFGQKNYNLEIHTEVAKFIQHLCGGGSRDNAKSSAVGLQMFLSCNGAPQLVSFLNPQQHTAQHRQLWGVSLAIISAVFDLSSLSSKNDFCRLFAKAGLADALVQLLLPLAAESDEEAVDLLGIVTNMLLTLANADSVVKMAICTPNTIKSMIAAVDKLALPMRLRIFKCFHLLSAVDNTLDQLQHSHAIRELVSRITHTEERFITEINREILASLYNLCMLCPARQEKAVSAGIVPHLLKCSEHHALKEFSLPILCDLVRLRSVRAELWRNHCVDFFLHLLSDPSWQTNALDVLAYWLKDEKKKVRNVLRHSKNINKIVRLFETTPDPDAKLVDALYRIVVASRVVARGLADTQLIGIVLGHLLADRGAGVRNDTKTTLMKMLQQLYKVSKCKRDLEEHFELAQNVALIREKSAGSRLVVKVADELLSAFKTTAAAAPAAAATAAVSEKSPASPTRTLPSPTLSPLLSSPGSPSRRRHLHDDSEVADGALVRTRSASLAAPGVHHSKTHSTSARHSGLPSPLNNVIVTGNMILNLGAIAKASDSECMPPIPDSAHRTAPQEPLPPPPVQSPPPLALEESNTTFGDSTITTDSSVNTIASPGSGSEFDLSNLVDSSVDLSDLQAKLNELDDGSDQQEHTPHNLSIVAGPTEGGIAADIADWLDFDDANPKSAAAEVTSTPSKGKASNKQADTVVVVSHVPKSSNGLLGRLFRSGGAVGGTKGVEKPQ